MRLLRHFVPDTDLNLETIKRMLARVDAHSNTTGEPTLSRCRTERATAQRASRGRANNQTPTGDDDSMELEETGPMIIDPLGRYRPQPVPEL